MYSVFLVDDESLIRDGIREMIEWNEYGFAFAGEAADGELAWPLIQKLAPDIVIADIKMPFMDGLALSRLIRKELPNTMVIIISGYDEFSYAKEALSIGVSEYLLKPINKKQLIEVLCEIKKRKDMAQAQAQYLDSQMQEYVEASRKNLLDALLNGRQLVSELLDRAKRLSIDLVAESYNVVFLFLYGAKGSQENSVQIAEQQSELGKRYPQSKNVFLCNIGGDGIAFLVVDDADQIEQQTKVCAECVEELCRSLPGIAAWKIGTGTPVYRLSSIADCFRQVRVKLLQQHARELLDTEEQQNASSAAVDFDPNEMNAGHLDQRIIEKFLSVGQEEGVPAFTEEFFSTIGRGAMESLLFRQYVALHVQFSVNAFLERLVGMGTEKTDNSRTDTPSVDEISTMEGTERYVCKLLLHALSVRDRSANNKHSNILSKAVSYMEEHFTNPDISLNMVAKVVNVRSTYFSAVFSQQMGKTFVEHLTELRMEKAKGLLRCSDKSSGDIAFEVGYNDPHYFSFLFKKVNGCSPRQYRAGGSRTT